MSLYNSYVSPANNNYNRDSFVDYQQQFQPAYQAQDDDYFDGFGSSMGGLYDSAKDGLGTDNWTAKGFSDVVGGLGGLYQMYQGNQMMGLAKKDMANRTNAYKTARADKDRFLSGTKNAFA